MRTKAGIDAKEEANAGLSFGIFGLLQRTFGGRTNAWNVRARLDTESSDLHCVDVTLMAQGGPSRILLRAQGTVDTLSRTGEMTDASVEQPLASLWGGEAVVSTRYSFVAHRPNVVVAYGKADTCVTVSGDAETQCVTIRQRSLDGNREIAPTVSTDGSVEFEYVRRNFGGRSGRTVTAVYKPEKAVTLICDEWPWSAKAVIPVDGYCNALLGGAKLTLQRSIE